MRTALFTHKIDNPGLEDELRERSGERVEVLFDVDDAREPMCGIKFKDGLAHAAFGFELSDWRDER